jgi:hypothetical protein
MRSLTTGGAAALNGQVVAAAILVEMDLTQQLLLNTSSLSLSIGGLTYSGVGGLGQIDAITENTGDFPKVRFTIAGVQPTSIALALTEPVQGKAVRIKTALFDSSTGALVDVRVRYAGYLDVMSITDGQDSAVISVTSESAMLDFLRTSATYYNDADQQSLSAGDLAFQYVNDQVESKIVWPAASFFKR